MVRNTILTSAYSYGKSMCEEVCVFLKYYKPTCETTCDLQLLWSVKIRIEKMAHILSCNKPKLTIFYFFFFMLGLWEKLDRRRENIQQLTFSIYHSEPKPGNMYLGWDWHTKFSKVMLFSLARGVHPSDSISHFWWKATKNLRCCCCFVFPCSETLLLSLAL